MAPCIEENCQDNAADSHLAAFSAAFPLLSVSMCLSRIRPDGSDIPCKNHLSYEKFGREMIQNFKTPMGKCLTNYASSSYGFLWIKIKNYSKQKKNNQSPKKEKRLQRFKPHSGREYPGLQCWPRSCNHLINFVIPYLF